MNITATINSKLRQHTAGLRKMARRMEQDACKRGLNKYQSEALNGVLCSW